MTAQLPRLGLLIVVFVTIAPAVLAEDAPSLEQRVGIWVEQFDSKRFVVRQRAYEQLVSQGQPVIPFLQRLRAGERSPEQRTRIRRAINEIQATILERGFGELTRTPADKDIDFEQAMWLVSCLVNPAARKSDLDKQLGRLTERVKDRLGAAPAQAAPADVVAAIQQVVFRDFGLKGELKTYDEPENSSLEFVLREKRGLPILLSHVAIAVGERLDLPLVGVPLPGRYMFKYDGDRAPKGMQQEDIVVDAFGGGRIVSRDEIVRLIGFDPRRYLQPTTRRETVSRMLRNLEADFLMAEQIGRAHRVRRYSAIMEP